MLLPPHRLLRSRFRAGLPTWFPPRLRLEGYFGQTGRTPAARFFAQNSSQLSLAVADDITNDLGVTYSRYSALLEAPHSEIPGSRADPRPYQALENLAVDEDDDDAAYYSIDDPILETFEDQPDVDHVTVGKVVYSDIKEGSVTRKRTRRVSRELKERDQGIRDKSLIISQSQLYEWREACIELFRLSSHGREPKQVVDLTEEDEALLVKIKEDCGGSFREAWEGLPKDEKASHWHRLSLWMLRNSPNLVPEFLLVTCQSAHIPVFMMVANTIFFLWTFHRETLTDFKTLVRTCLDPHIWPVLFLPQKPVRMYLTTVDREAVYEAYDLARRRRVQIKAETFLCFMRRFTEFNDIEKALEMLRFVQALGHPLDSRPVLRHCCKLLMLDSVVNLQGERNFRILPKLLEIGVRPNQEMMNVILSNALKTGDPQLGLDILDYMKEQGIPPDSYTYLSLLKDAVARLDRTRFESLVLEIKSRTNLAKNPWIASKILHYHFLCTAKHINPDDDPKEIFAAMIDHYVKVHDITPLKELSILPPHYTPPPGNEVSPPSTVALYIIIATYLRCQRQLNTTTFLYSRFRSLVLEGHESIAPLAATSHTYNEFLVSFRHNPQGLRPAVNILEDMMLSSSKGLVVGQSKRSQQPLVHSKPDHITWTILLSAFIFNNQSLAAEKVRRMMDKYNVKYAQVTWNTIISGLASWQQTNKLAKTIKEMETAGFGLNDYSLRSLRYLRDPDRLWAAIEELDRVANSDSDHNFDGKAQRMNEEQLLESGLQRLKANMKHKA